MFRGCCVLTVLLSLHADGWAADRSDRGRYVFSVKSGWSTSPDEAWDDVLQNAQTHLAAHLRAQEPPIRTVPTRDAIRNHHIFSRIPERKQWFDSPINAHMYELEVEVEITPEQIRDLRAQDRSRWMLRMIGVCWIMLIIAVLSFKLRDGTYRSMSAPVFVLVGVILVLGAFVLLFQ